MQGTNDFNFVSVNYYNMDFGILNQLNIPARTSLNIFHDSQILKKGL